ncbi:hypothetical protein N824_14365 [Pedobacter sp. V48]|nr:hypothetical protein N824_14365 [Pedobacter sp. V48]
MAEQTKITVEATVNAPVEKVWKAWNTPADIIQWNTPTQAGILQAAKTTSA